MARALRFLASSNPYRPPAIIRDRLEQKLENRVLGRNIARQHVSQVSPARLDSGTTLLCSDLSGRLPLNRSLRDDSLSEASILG